MKGLSYTVNGKRILMKCHSPHCGATLTKVLDVLKSGEGYSGANGHEEATPIRVKDKGAKPGTGGMAWWIEKTGVEEKYWRGLGTEEYGSGSAS